MHLHATQETRARKVTVGVEKIARELAGHLEFMHGGIKIPIDKVAKRGRGTDPDFAEMTAFHEQLHRDGSHLMRFAHHHDPTFDAGGTKR